MTKIQEAIQLAIKGGWIYPSLEGQMTWSMKWEKFGGWDYCWLKCYDDISEGFWAVKEIIFLDPLFWQALFKGNPDVEVSHGNWDDMKTMTTESIPQWKSQFHRFIDHLIEGKDAEEFFK